MPDDLLSRIPGGSIADALQTLPDAARADQEVMEAFVDVPEIGRVQITARRLEHTRGRSAHYYWTAESAALVSG
jgi:hypothetical protein